MLSIKCSKCGSIYHGNFCPNCGTPANQPGIQNQPNQYMNGPYISPEKKKHGCLFYGLITFGIIIFLFLFSVIFTSCIKALSSISDRTTSIISSENAGPETTIIPSEEPVKELSFAAGDTIKTDDMEVTINKIEFSYDVKPDNTSSFYTHYESDKGSVYIHIDADVKNLSKQTLGCDEILSVKADYDNGYIYDGEAIAEDSATGFTYAMISSIDSLKTQGVHFIISCPEEVEESDNPLFLTIRLQGTKDTYKYIFRQ